MLKLTRTRFSPQGIFGEITKEGVHICYTLEHSFDSKPALPAGIYTCKRGLHQLATMAQNFVTFEVQNVPGHTGILFHTGNVNGDSLGCILVGEKVKGDVLLQSRAAFSTFMTLLARTTDFQLEVVDEA